ncbi:hypothetical protein N0V95_007230 [Ascochyta clinopodiicola]|nr:hypothetical protein N0V95_007230 [Ascochyta clinopodiicola]
MTQSARKEAKDPVNAAYVDLLHFNHPATQWSRDHTVLPTLRSDTSTFRHAVESSQATRGAYLPPHLRQKADTPSKPKASSITFDQAAAVSLVRNGKKTKTQKAKDLDDTGFEHEDAAGVMSGSVDENRFTRTDRTNRKVKASATYANNAPRKHNSFVSGNAPAAECHPWDLQDDEPVWSSDHVSNLSARADDSDGPGLGSSNNEFLEQRMLEDFGYDDFSCPSYWMPGSVASASAVAGRTGQQEHNANDRQEQNYWGRSCCSSVYEPGFSKTSVDLDKEGHQTEDDRVCQQSSELHTGDDAYANVAKGTTRTNSESAVAKEATPNYLAPPEPREPSSARPGEALKHAWELLELQRYESVDQDTLQNHVSNVMMQSSNFAELATAFSAVCKHQEETSCWDLRLCWTNVDDEELLEHVVNGQLKGRHIAACNLQTSVEDCLRRWKQIKPQDVSLEKTNATTTNEPHKTTYPDGWNAELDEKLLDLKTNHQTYSSIATELGKSIPLCKSRFRQIKPTDWKLKPMKQIKKEATNTPWTPQLDRNLLSLRKKKEPWRKIHEVLGMSVQDCKARFSEIAPKGGKPKSKKGSKKSSTKLFILLGGEYANEDAHADKQHGDGWMTPDESYDWGEIKSKRDHDGVNNNNISFNADDDKPTVQFRDCGCEAGDWCFGHEAAPTAGEDPWGAADTSDKQAYRAICCNRPDWCGCGNSTDQINAASKNAEAADGWGTVAEHGDPWGDCGSRTPPPYDHNNPSWNSGLKFPVSSKPASSDCGGQGWSGPDTSQSKPWSILHPPYTVSYWATIESGDDQIHVNIDSKNVSGPEKSVVNGGMQKLWKWVHDKDLTGKIGLQDTFDLAQAMHEGEQDEEVEAVRIAQKDRSVAESVYRSRSGSERGAWGAWEA